MKNEYYQSADGVIHIIFNSKRHEHKEAYIDELDFDIVDSLSSWSLMKGKYTFYAAHLESYGSKPVLMHRFILNSPQNKHVDHWDRNGLNNCRSNIFIVSARQNHHNRRDQKQFIGVTERTSGRYNSVIFIHKKNHYLPLVSTERQAAFCYNVICMALGDANVHEISLSKKEKSDLLTQLIASLSRKGRNKISLWIIRGLIVLLRQGNFEKFREFILYTSSV